MSREPIFIVGAPRSGTTLLAAILAGHSRISCGPETHFFRRLAEADEAQLQAMECWPETAVQFISAITHSAFAGHESKQLLEKYQLSDAQITAYLASKPPSIPAILASVTEQYMLRQGKARWAEKTPDHLAHTQLIRQHFPTAPVVRIVRDPRDMALSLLKVPWGAKSFTEALLFWRRLDDASRDFFHHDARAYTLRFEDLLRAPQPEIEKLCQFLGESFEEEMLDTSAQATAVNSRNVSWKAKVGQQFDPSRIGVWQRECSPAQNQLAEAMIGDRLTAYGYPLAATFSDLADVYPSIDLAVKCEDGLAQVAAHGVRFWPISDDEQATAKVYLGDPGYDHWLGQKRAEQMQDTIRLSAEILRATTTQTSIFWVQERQPEDWSGYGAFLIRRLLNPHKVLVKE